MNTISFEDLLPQASTDPSTALQQIQRNMGLYSTEGFFENGEFIGLFSQKIAHIVENLPMDKDLKKSMERDLAYICHDLQRNQAIILTCHNQQAWMRHIELLLEEEGVLMDYLGFIADKKDTLDMSKPDLVIQFLNYLTGYLSNGVEDVTLYVRTCIRISQMEGGIDILMIHFQHFGNENITTISHTDFLIQLLDYLGRYISMGIEPLIVYIQTCIQVSQLDVREDILMTHLARVFDTLPHATIVAMIDDHGYVGGNDWDPDMHIDAIMEGEGLSREEAIQEFEKMRQDCAGFHAFLATIYNEYIIPNIGNLPKKRQIEIRSMLNDFRDIVDPEGYIPLFFDSGNTIEMIERNKAVKEGREVH